MVKNDEGTINEKDVNVDIDVVDLLPGYVMGILEPNELLLVENYIRRAPNIGARLVAMDESIATLAFAAPPQALPLEMKSRVMARAVENKNSDPRTAPVQNIPMDSNMDSPTQIQRVFDPNRVPNKARRLQTAQAPEGFELLDVATSWWRRALGWKIATALATAAAVASLLFIFQNQATVGEMQSKVTTAEQNLASLQSEVDAMKIANEELAASKAELETQLTTQNALLAAQEIAPEEEIARLSTAQQAIFLGGTDEAPQADGSLFVNADNAGTLLLSGLEPLPDDQTYQLWVILAEGDPISAGLFVVSDAEATIVTFELPAIREEYAKMDITIEPASGSPAPTGPLVLRST